MPRCRNSARILLVVLPVYFCAAQETALLPEPAPEAVEARFGTTVVLPSGLRGQIYYLRPNTLSLPTRETGTGWHPSTPTASIFLRRDFTEGFPGVIDRLEWFAIDYTGRFYINNPGKYRFAVALDDGLKLGIDGRCIISNDGIHGTLRVDGAVRLEGGIHTIRLSYFQGPRFSIALMLGVAGPGDTDFRVFNTNEFKPPAHPEDWKYGSPDDLKTSPDPNAGRKKLKDADGIDAKKDRGNERQVIHSADATFGSDRFSC